MNNKKEEILDLLFKSKKTFIFPHTSIDGDAFGSSIALALALKEKGRECRIIIEEEIPYILKFLEDFTQGEILFVNDFNQAADLAVLIDSGDVSRIGENSRKIFEKCKVKLCIDHHKTSTAKFDYNYIFKNAAATAEIIISLLKNSEINISREIATALYTGLMTDTGRFSYSNVNEKTFMHLSYLLKKNADKNLAFYNIYENIRIERIMIEGDCLSKLKTYYDGRLGISYLTKKMLDKRGAIYEDGDAVVEKIRQIKGIEVALFIKEKKDGKIKVSLRSKKDFDVADFAAKFNGGGHSRAAGFDSNLYWTGLAE